MSMSIGTLLNPAADDPDDIREYQTQSWPADSGPPGVAIVSLTSPKAPKLPKDVIPFTKAEPLRGHIPYPPHEDESDAELAHQLRRFRIFPQGEISRYHRTIPYSSNKKNFQEKTGRSGFEVFQYVFQLPPDLRGCVADELSKEKFWYVAWDHTTGLVRMTSFFKALGYAKTVPKKMLTLNNIDDHAFNVTGGSIPAQGYWVPFEAAKAAAATFCYKIRYALTPVFGKEFLALCIPPGHQNFANFMIPQEIIDEFIARANRQADQDIGYRSSDIPPVLESSRSSSVRRSTRTRNQTPRRTSIEGDSMGYSPFTTTTPHGVVTCQSSFSSPMSNIISPTRSDYGIAEIEATWGLMECKRESVIIPAAREPSGTRHWEMRQAADALMKIRTDCWGRQFPKF